MKNKSLWSNIIFEKEVTSNYIKYFNLRKTVKQWCYFLQPQWPIDKNKNNTFSDLLFMHVGIHLVRILSWQLPNVSCAFKTCHGLMTYFGTKKTSNSSPLRQLIPWVTFVSLTENKQLLTGWWRDCSFQLSMVTSRHFIKRNTPTSNPDFLNLNKTLFVGDLLLIDTEWSISLPFI